MNATADSMRDRLRRSLAGGRLTTEQLTRRLGKSASYILRLLNSEPETFVRVEEG